MLWALNVSDINGLATSAPVAYTLKYGTTVSKAGVAATSAVGGRTHEIW
jgi:hypothetical protein